MAIAVSQSADGARRTSTGERRNQRVRAVVINGEVPIYRVGHVGGSVPGGTRPTLDESLITGTNSDGHHGNGGHFDSALRDCSLLYW